MAKNTSTCPLKVRTRALKLAEKIGVSNAARELGLHRNTLHNWKRRQEQFGKKGLKPHPRRQTSHPQTTPTTTVKTILDLALAHPSFGCYRLQQLLPTDVRRVSTTTIQNVLNKNDLGSKMGRQLALERSGSLDGLSEEQTAFITRMNPCFPKCNVRNQGPGWSMVMGSWKIRTRDSQGDRLLFVVLDVWTGYAFGVVTTDEQKDLAVADFRFEISRFYRGWGGRVKNAYLFDGMEASDSSLLSYDSDHHRRLSGLLTIRAVRRKHRSCCLERFQKIVTKEFFESIPGDEFSSDADGLNLTFQKWLRSYNADRKHEGYPHNGRTPLYRFHFRPKVRLPREESAKPVQNPVRDGKSSINKHGLGHALKRLMDLPVDDDDPPFEFGPHLGFIWYYCNRHEIESLRKASSGNTAAISYTDVDDADADSRTPKPRKP